MNPWQTFLLGINLTYDSEGLKPSCTYLWKGARLLPEPFDTLCFLSKGEFQLSGGITPLPFSEIW